jgi:nitrilase
MSKVAIVQQPPVLLNKQATIQQAVTLVAEAAGKGAQLVVFPEAYVPGYPAWIWRLRPGGDWGLNEQIHARLLDNAVSVEGGDLDALCTAAREHGVTVVCGMDERDSQHSQATLYNTMVIIDHHGRLLNRHRKLMPTNPERMVWGFGDASGLKVVDSPCGRIGTLICWENYMPLARYALYAQGLDVYIAPTYDSGDAWIGTLQHISREAGCWVIGSGNIMRASDIPDDFPERAKLYPDAEEWVNPGDSVVIAPGGKIVAGPMRQEPGILYADIDKQQTGLARRSLDVVGHYARPDIFKLSVNTTPQSPVEFK